MNKAEIISRHAQALKGQVGTSLAIDECEDIMASMMNEAINFIRCSTQLPTLEEIKLKAKQETSFPKMCYPNEIIEISCCAKYKEGAEWMREQLMK